ncbi:MAG TPA: D-alanyl-D-alanine carboxypeptidase family protein, partial [Stellaceae bacterium]|nr:D-alanyl-D-alanine carboxypeptidase family protein [Stellaceae bacterium]
PPARRLRSGVMTFVAVLLAFGTAIAVSAPVQAAQYSSIVIDAQTGQVVSEYNADSPNYPASLTKMMTLYLTFTALEHHDITLDTVFPVSPHAAAQEPTKLNLVAGQMVTVHDLILGLVTQSANDAAVVLGEGLGGTEAAFAERMTITARSMGMDSTTFHNASGLPNPFQKTTARDLSKLARRLYLDFPREYAYFSTRSFTYHGVTYGNHNHLMSAFAGMDGIKTGFINASGFNLAASAVRDNRRLIGVEMGGVSAHARDMKMAALLNAAFDGRPSPDILMAANQPKHVLIASAQAKKPTQSRLTLHMIARRAVGGLARLSPISKAEAATAPRNASHYAIQVGAFRARALASRAAVTARAHAPTARRKPAVVVMTRSHHGAVYNARIIDLSANQAKAACDTLHRHHQACAVLGPAMQVAGQKTGGATPLSRS